MPISSNSSLRILHISTTSPTSKEATRSPTTISILSVTQGQGHGAERVLIELLRDWKGRNSPLSLHVIAPAHSSVLDCAQDLGIAWTNFPSSRDAMMANLLALRRLGSAFTDSSLLHAWTARAFDPGALLARRLCLPFTGTLHDHPRASFHGTLRQRLMRRAAKRMQQLFCVSDAVRQACSEAGYRCDTTVAYNGLSAHQLPTGVRTNESVQLGFPGMYADWKGFSIVHDWINALKDQNVCWNLYGEVSEQNQALLQDLPPSRIKLHGHVPADRIFQDNDIIVHASTGFDPFPTVLLEAARAARPVIASCLGGSVESVLPGQTGFLFDPRDPEDGLNKLRSLLRNPERREQMGQNARTRYESHYQSHHMTDRYETLWREVLSNEG